jgi:hypothetical protein
MWTEIIRCKHYPSHVDSVRMLLPCVRSHTFTYIFFYVCRKEPQKLNLINLPNMLQVEMFVKPCMAYSLIMNIEAVCYSGTSETYQTTWFCITVD